MKKVISIVMALVMMMAVMVPAFAETTLNKNPDEADVIINTSTTKADGSDAESYTVVIPADTTIPWGQETTDVSFTVETHLKRNANIVVFVKGSDVMKTADGAYEIPYTLTGEGTAYRAEGNPVVYPAYKAEVTVNIPADNWNNAVVEEYSDTLTYTAEIERASV